MKYNNIFFFLAASALCLTSCSDNGDWKPGEDLTGGKGVFFRPLDSYSLTVEPDDNHVLKVAVSRTSTAGAQEVKLNHSYLPQGVTAPASVTFADGEDTAFFEIDITGMPVKTSDKLEISLDPSLAYVYGEGSTTLDLDITMTGDWLVLADDMKILFTSDLKGEKPIYPTLYNQKLYYLDGGYRWKIPDFAQSGIDLPFTVKNIGIYALEVRPTKNVTYFFWEGDEYLEGSPDRNPNADYFEMYLYDSDNDTYPVWSPDGSLPEIGYLWTYAEYGYNIYSFADGWISFFGYLEYTDDSSQSFALNYLFTPLFDPAELEKQNAAQGN